MKILALDTATEACSAALLCDGTAQTRFEATPRKHASLILPFVDELLSEAGFSLNQLDAIAISRGPGSFTGIRIGFALAQGLAMGAGLGVVPVSTLHALALAAYDDAPAPLILAVLDARMGEVYAGGFDFGQDALGVPELAEQVCDPASLRLDGSGRWLAAGPGVAVYREVIEQVNPDRFDAFKPELLSRADCVARLADRHLSSGEEPVDPVLAQPVYLRQRVADTPG
ncbi:MAG: tRNA (adenosine(37)-N6)-threonylcarbamoyltransferase complex dimerization subunit type 1 TsaB [Xanthomonadales bacterium]|nr:tRNA (adenosine(37)-N6)-threonylcarbamoyltransferase complex dimerization subunit type 1 TsaB [Xanthomonadales bacterium]